MLRESLNSLVASQKAEGFRARVAKRNKRCRQICGSSTASTVNNLTNALHSVQSAKPTEPPLNNCLNEPAASQDLTISHRGKRREIHVELIDDPAESQWLAVSDKPVLARGLIKLK